MTVIAYRDGILAADSAGWYGDVLGTEAHNKVRRVPGGGVAAAAGCAPQIEQFHDWLASGEFGKPFECDEEGEFGALYIDRDGLIWRYDYLLRRYANPPPWAVEGCHNEFMLACMWCGKDAIEAVELAIRCCQGAAGHVVWMKLETE